MPFPTEGVLSSDELASHLKVAGGPEGEGARVHTEANALLTDAFEHAWRPVPVEVANECLIRVAQALIDSKRGQRAGQQRATVEGGTNVRPSIDPLDSARPLIDRYVVRL